MTTHIFSSKLPFSSRLSRLVPLAAMLTVFAAAPALAQEEPSTMQKILGAAGILELPKAPIDYEERAPLVVPPSSELPPPGSAADVRRLNPEWPVDQDIKRARAERKDAHTSIDMVDDTFYGTHNVLPPDQLRRKKADKNATRSASTGPYDPNSAGAEAYQNKEHYLPSRLGFKGFGKKDGGAVFKGEPERTSLLEPPPGYRTPSPNAPYGIVEGERKVFNINKHYDRNDDRNDRF